MENIDIDPAKACFIEREFEADDKELPAILAFLEEELEKHDAGPKQTMALSLAVAAQFSPILPASVALRVTELTLMLFPARLCA